MFKKAVAQASKFTFPVVMSRTSVNGECGCGNGAFVVLNNQGWVITAGHIVDQFLKLQEEEKKVAEHRSAVERIRQDVDLSEKERRHALQRLGKLAGSLTEHAAVWWADVGSDVETIVRLPGMDFAAVKLSNFDQSKVSAYPLLKDREADLQAGTSLCKLGFPFCSETPTFDANTKEFRYQNGKPAMLKFPIDGILTRLQSVQVVDQHGNALQSNFPLINVETSSPGLLGQSGGPIFDTEGHIYALQAFTSHTPLGFSPSIAVNGTKHVEHQFINLGLGPSSVSIAGLLAQQGITFHSAP